MLCGVVFISLRKYYIRCERNACTVAAIGFANKYMDKDELEKLLEVSAMADLIAKLIEKNVVEIAKKMLKRGMSIDAVAEDTGLEESTIRALYAELDVA